MRSLIALFTMLPLLASCSDAAESEVPQPGFAATASAEAPIVVELFQSQGCSSCPPANAALNALADRKNVIALSFAVTYWDRLGWKDTFATPAFTQRQRDYAATLKGGSVYTPQAIINGRRELVGNGKGEMARAVGETNGLTGGPTLSTAGDVINISAGQGKATVWLVRFDPRTHNVPIRAGENGGQTLPHRNIVRELTKLGSWSGKQARYDLPKADNANYKGVIILQGGTTGPIIAAKRL